MFGDAVGHGVGEGHGRKFMWSVTNGMALIQNDGHITTDDELANNSFFAFGLDFSDDGDARVMTLDAASATVTSASLMLSNPSGAGLIAHHSTKPNDTTAMVGTASMTIQSVVATSVPGVWEVHGTATATMVRHRASRTPAQSRPTPASKPHKLCTDSPLGRLLLGCAHT